MIYVNLIRSWLWNLGGVLFIIQMLCGRESCVININTLMIISLLCVSFKICLRHGIVFQLLRRKLFVVVDGFSGMVTVWSFGQFTNYHLGLLLIAMFRDHFLILSYTGLLFKWWAGMVAGMDVWLRKLFPKGSFMRLGEFCCRKKLWGWVVFCGITFLMGYSPQKMTFDLLNKSREGGGGGYSDTWRKIWKTISHSRDGCFL